MILKRVLYLGSLVSLTIAAPKPPVPCRFASQWTSSQILSHPDSFEDALLYWEGKFHQHNVSYNAVNGMTFDGTLLDKVTGVHRVEGLHTFSAASKESLHFMMLAHVIDGNRGAARWILSGEGEHDLGNVEKARKVAFGILEKKWMSYSQFNQTYPGFGGFLPWFAHTESTILTPTFDWVNRVPALDNGENIWAIYATIEALLKVGNKKYDALAHNWQSYLDYLKTTAGKVFYRGEGHICAVTDLANQSLPVDHPDQSYKCEGTDQSSLINDPYEGQSFMFFFYLFGNLKKADKEALLAFKRPKLVSVEWSMPGYQKVTVQKGFWFSSHENWGWMQLPYTDIPLMKDLYANMERARTCDSQAKRLPGMFASINNSTDENGEIIGYISNAGIPAIANQTVQELDVITPYSTMNTMIVDKTVGYLWWHNMAVAKRMQNLYGSSESTRIDGTATSAFVSWDSKITTVNGILGGVTSLVRPHMQRDGIYNEFIEVVKSEYGRVFNKPLKGMKQEFCLPHLEVEDTGLVDFTTC
ncbi:hypothetical protein AGABI1DRAFT_55288, partial [Agaricus bisporus var. burnettii JB137-S8]